MRVVAPDRGRALALAGLLAAYEADVVAEDGGVATVRLNSVPENCVPKVLHAVEASVRAEGITDARVEIDDRTYTMVG